MTSDFAAASAALLLITSETSPEAESYSSNVLLLQCICCLALRQAEPFRVAVDSLSSVADMVPMSALMRSLDAACREQNWSLAEEMIDKMMLHGACADALHRAFHSLRASP
jgi:pentatricopeptide repeat protein